MSESIIVALITGLTAILAQIVISVTAAQKMRTEDAVWKAQIVDRLGVIDKKIDEHNGYAEKFASLTEAIIGMKRDIEYLKEK